MNKYPSDGFAAFVVSGKARIIGPVKQSEIFAYAKDVIPLFSETLDGLKAIIASKGYVVL